MNTAVWSLGEFWSRTWTTLIIKLVLMDRRRSHTAPDVAPMVSSLFITNLLMRWSCHPWTSPGCFISHHEMPEWVCGWPVLSVSGCVLCFQSVSSPLQSLQQRTWLIHWSLFVFFNHPKGRDNIIELFLYQPQSVAFTHLDSNTGSLLTNCFESTAVTLKFC